MMASAGLGGVWWPKPWVCPSSWETTSLKPVSPTHWAPLFTTTKVEKARCHDWPS